MFSPTYPPWRSRTENNLNIFIAESSDSNRKLSSLDKIYLLQGFYSSTKNNFQRETNSKHSLRLRLHISEHYLTTTENILSVGEKIFMDSIVIYKWMEIQQNWPLQVRALIILVLNLPSTTIQQFYIQLLQLYAWDRRVYCEMIGQKAYDCITRGPKWLPPSLRQINSTPFVVKNQLNHQDIGTANLQ